MNNREIWHEQNFKFGRVDPTSWIPFEEELGFFTKLWRGIKLWACTQ